MSLDHSESSWHAHSFDLFRLILPPLKKSVGKRCPPSRPEQLRAFRGAPRLSVSRPMSRGRRPGRFHFRLYSQPAVNRLKSSKLRKSPHRCLTFYVSYRTNQSFRNGQKSHKLDCFSHNCSEQPNPTVDLNDIEHPYSTRYSASNTHYRLLH